MTQADDPGPDVRESHPCGYPWRARLEDIRLLRTGEGEGVFAAAGEGAFWIVHDSGTLADFLDDDEDAALLATLVSLDRYDDEERWAAAVDRIVAEARRDELRKHYGRHPYAQRRIDVLVHSPRGSRTVRLPLGQVWRARDSQQLVILGTEPADDRGFVRYVEILDEFGLVTLGSTDGLITPTALDSSYELVSDPRAVADELHADS